MTPEPKGIERRWTLYICDKCGRHGHVFQESRPCDYGGRHHGKHGGPVEVMPVSDHLAVLGEEQQRAAWDAKDLVCTGCKRAISFDACLPGLQCGLCPHCRRPLRTAEGRQYDRAEAAEKKAFDQHVMVGEAHTQLEETREKLQGLKEALEAEVAHLTASASSKRRCDKQAVADRLQAILDTYSVDEGSGG